jgi:hypothetical protein
MADGKTSVGLGRAILSLLVAVDQRCPAIIGQAHLLYHARFSTELERDAMKAFAQLKRDADDLVKAIADVEAALEKETGHEILQRRQRD